MSVNRRSSSWNAGAITSFQAGPTPRFCSRLSRISAIVVTRYDSADASSASGSVTSGPVPAVSRAASTGAAPFAIKAIIRRSLATSSAE